MDVPKHSCYMEIMYTLCRAGNYMYIYTCPPTYRYSFFVRTIPTWGRLPLAVVQAPSVKQFQEMALPVLRDMKPTTTQIKL